MKFLAREDFESWVKGLIAAGPVIAPTRVDSLVLYKPVDKLEQIEFCARPSNLSCKSWFFPMTDTLFTLDHGPGFTVEKGGGETRILPAKVEQNAVVFGLLPCDARALAILDKPFMESPCDALYAQRREKTTLAGIACNEPGPACFCTSMGAGPRDSSNLDILLIEVEGGYLVEAGTEKGKALLSGVELADSTRDPPPPPVLPSVPTDSITDAARQSFNNDYWERLADRCIHCNTCSYVCPTCYCFDIRDHNNKGTTERVRTWESCQSPGFTRIAGGYNPRPTKGARLRQRFAHKLLYFPERYGMLKCTGCGRCVTACPVNIDIREVVQDLRELNHR